MRTPTLLPILAAACALAVALLAGTGAAHASPLTDAADALAPGGWVELATDDIAVLGVGSHAGNALTYAQSAVWDPARDRFHYVGADHGAPDMTHYYYDAPTNTWVDLGLIDSWGHGYEHLAIDAEHRVLYQRVYSLGSEPDGHTILSTNVDAPDAWTDTAHFPDSYAQVGIAIVFVPGRGLLVYNCGEPDGQIAIMDASGSWTDLRGVGGSSRYSCFVEHSVARDTVIFGGGGDDDHHVWRLEPDGAATALADSPVSLGTSYAGGTHQGNVVADPNSGDFLVLGEGQFWSLDPTGAGTWSRLPDPSDARVLSSPEMISAAVSNHGVVMYVVCATSTCATFLYRHAPGSGTPVDFDAGVPPPPPSDGGTTPPSDGGSMSTHDGGSGGASDAGTTPGADGSAGADAGAGAGPGPGTSTGGCSVGGGRADGCVWVLALAALALASRRRAQRLGVALACCAALAVGCGDGGSDGDGGRGVDLGPSHDAGPVAHDEGVPRDGGAPSTDAGGGLDAHATLHDAGPVARASFDERCAAPGVLRCIGFDDASELAGGAGDPTGVLAGENGPPAIDTSESASGAGSLLFVVPPGSGSDPNGSYFADFSDDYSIQFDGGEEFFVQWRQRFSRDFVDTVWQATDGLTGWKQTIIGAGDQPGCSPSHSTGLEGGGGSCAFSCTALELVTTRWYEHHYPIQYNSCSGSASHGPYDMFEEPFGSSDFKTENAMPDPFCTYHLQADGTEGNCFYYRPDQWMTFQVHVVLGPRVGDEFVGSIVELFGAYEGETSVRVIDWGDVDGGHPAYNLSAGDPALNERYGKVWLTPYMTRKDPAQLNPESRTWYDELIVSRDRIADP